jgi:hypothetical protein
MNDNGVHREDWNRIYRLNLVFENIWGILYESTDIRFNRSYVHSPAFDELSEMIRLLVWQFPDDNSNDIPGVL